jgi:hypothetical protein
VAVPGCSGCSGFYANFLTKPKRTRGSLGCSECLGCSCFYANFLTGQNSEVCGSLTSSTDEKDDDRLAREPVDGISKHAQHPADQHLVAVEDVSEELHRYGGWEVEPLKRRRTRVIHSIHSMKRSSSEVTELICKRLALARLPIDDSLVLRQDSDLDHV